MTSKGVGGTWLTEGVPYKEVVVVGRDPSVASRKVARHGGRAGYWAAAVDTTAGGAGMPEAVRG